MAALVLFVFRSRVVSSGRSCSLFGLFWRPLAAGYPVLELDSKERRRLDIFMLSSILIRLSLRCMALILGESQLVMAAFWNQLQLHFLSARS